MNIFDSKKRAANAVRFLFGCLSAKKPPAKPVRIKSFSFKKKTSSVTIDVATNRIMKQRRYFTVE